MIYGLRPMRRPLMRDPRLLIDWHGGTPFPAGGYTRGSDGTTRGADGVYRQAAAGIPRTTWRRDASGLLVPATLLEPAATNLMQYGEPTVAQLAVSGGGVVDAGPLFGFTNWLEMPAYSGTTVNAYGRATLAEGATYTASVFVRTDDGASPLSRFTFRRAGGALVGSPSTAKEVAPGLWRCSLTFVAPAAQSNTSFGVARASGSGSGKIWVTGLQIEPTGYLSSYFRTTGASAARAADSLYLDLPVEIRTPGAALVVYARYVVRAAGTSLADDPAAWGIAASGGASPRLHQTLLSTDGRVRLAHNNGSTGNQAATTLIPVPGDLVETLSLIWTDSAGLLTGRLIASVNRGPLSAADLPPLAPSAAWSAPRLYVGSRGTAPGVYDGYERLRVWSGFIAGSDERRTAFARGEI